MINQYKINSVLVIGAGPIIIGQACEFDYSGVQACLELKNAGCRTILINSNPATIMTDPEIADATYIEPITWEMVEKIIEKERPDALLPIVGGQTALNCTIDLVEHGVIEKFNIKIIGSSYETIKCAEDRECFKKIVKEIGIDVPKSFVIHSKDEFDEIKYLLKFPLIIRNSFVLGGAGSGIAANSAILEQIVERSLLLSPNNIILLEESVIGWKEYELEVMRDKNGNCIVVCSIENFDPMGVHTGDSITVAPAQTLTDKEYQKMRQIAFMVMEQIKMTSGGCNVQFAVNPDNGEMLVIEVNPRVSRSSALASKATGFPIARVATKLALGFTLDEIKNKITGEAIPASFEPSIDYVVTKIPYFNFEKFPNCSSELTTQMKSVGEVMAFGRNFQESLHKAMLSMENGLNGFNELAKNKNDIRQKLVTPNPRRLWFIADAFRFGFTLEDVATLTNIDSWFLNQIQELVGIENEIKKIDLQTIEKDSLFRFKQKGFSDARIADLCNTAEYKIRKIRQSLGVYPVYKRVDSCAGEFPSSTAYLYSTYERACEARPTSRQKVLIIGSGPNRIGQGIEFDYCCVKAACALRDIGYETIMVNCNPETVSTDYDISDRLYFEPLRLEHVLAIIDIEKPLGVLIQFGGQTPLRLAAALEEHGINLIGTCAKIIDRAENRQSFKELLDKIQLKQSPSYTFLQDSEAFNFAYKLGYPLVLRPSYVLGGRAINLVRSNEDLKEYLKNNPSNGFPILIEKFLEDAIEIEVDVVCDAEKILITGIMEQFEPAGIHSGDSTCFLPAVSLTVELLAELKRQINLLVKELKVIGLANIQFAIQHGNIYIIEVNTRASRTVPFISKATGYPIVKIAVNCLLGKSLSDQGISIDECRPIFNYVVKMPVFPVGKFSDDDIILNMEMKSTGEVMGIGETLQEALYKAQIAAGKQTVSASQEKINIYCLQDKK